MKSTPKTLDYFKLGCCAGNFVVIFTAKNLRLKFMVALRRVRLTRSTRLRPITDLLKSFPDEIPETPLPQGSERFQAYCEALMELREIVLYQGNRQHYQWYMVGDALYRLATASGLTPDYPIDNAIFTFETAVAEATPPKAIRSMCDHFVRLAKRRRGDHDAVFSFAWKVEDFASTFLTVSFD